MSDRIKYLVRIFFPVQIVASEGLVLEKWATFDPFWPLGCPPKKSKIII